ncbi:inositol monophosphatase family protein [Streptococcus sp. DD13]|uniref:inositol monophosphatase family protein n=1 Tax=Streptococcus sp. DD13 TaxID=1777881 RepID=UPI000797583F|nr:inositol monophosphatase family protein [Streptococcus sp. DD13]KXT78647.1 Inositol-1-monophosphatase [Streptococcus sp. DD13]
MLESKYQFGRTVIESAAQLLRNKMFEELEIEIKSTFTDLVTNLDTLIQEEMSQAILATYPEDIIVGEETQERPDSSQGSVWIIDPIDGTSNFIAQKNDFAILLSYFEDGVGKFAFIYDVMKDQLFHGGGEFPVYLNDQQLPAYQEKELKQSLLALNANLVASNYAGLRDLSQQCLGTRSYGSAGISMSYVLSGRMMAYVSYLYPWDYAAASILGENLGYEVVTLDGEKPNFKDRQVVMMIPIAKREDINRYLKHEFTS